MVAFCDGANITRRYNFNSCTVCPVSCEPDKECEHLAYCEHNPMPKRAAKTKTLS